jgi:hypothetical protein
MPCGARATAAPLFSRRGASGAPVSCLEPDCKSHGPTKLEFSPRLCIENRTRTPRLASRSVPERTVFLCVLSVLCVSILALRAGPITKPVFRHGSNPATTQQDHCEKNRRPVSQWSVAIKLKMPCCCDTPTDHCEKSAQHTLFFHDGQVVLIIRPCRLPRAYLHLVNGVTAPHLALPYLAVCTRCARPRLAHERMPNSAAPTDLPIGGSIPGRRRGARPHAACRRWSAVGHALHRRRCRCVVHEAVCKSFLRFSPRF